MTHLYIYKKLVKGLAPVARLHLLPGRVEVESSELHIQTVLAGVLSRPALISVWHGSDLVKVKPETEEGGVVASLKRFLPRPYFASRDVPGEFHPRYTDHVETPGGASRE